MNRIRIKENLVVIGLILAATFWIVEAAIHMLLFKDGNLADQILQPDANEIWMRSLVGLIFITFSIYAKIIVRQLSQAKERLQQSNSTLESQVKERTAELEESNRQLKDEIERRIQNEHALRQSEQRYSSLYASMSEGIALHRIIYDESGCATDYEILDVNPAFVSILGIERKDAIGAKASELYGTGQAPYLEVYSRVAGSGESVSFETTFEPIDKSFKISAFSPAEGEFATLFEDVTERKRAQEREARANRLFSTAFHANPVPATITTVSDDKLMMVNDAWLKLIGFDSQEEVVGKSAVELNLWADIEDREERNTNLQQAGFSSKQEIRVRTPSGQIRNCIYVAEMIDYEGQSHILSMAIDISERKKTQEALRILFESTMATIGAEFFDTLANSLCRWLDVDCVIIGQVDEKETINALAMWLDGKAVPDYSYKLSGTPCDDVAKKGYCSYHEGVCGVFPDDEDLVNLGAEGYVGTHLRDSSGKAIGILCGISRNRLNLPPNTKEVMAVIAARASAEIERRQTENALRESEERYRTVVENAGEGIVVVQDGRLQFINPYIEAAVGHTQEELTSRPFIEFVHPDDRNRVMDIHTRRLKGEEVSDIYEFRTIDKHGKTRWLENNGILIQWLGRPATLNFLRDITYRKHAEEALRESEEKFRSLAEQSPNMIFIFKQGRIVYANKKCEELMGYKKEEFYSPDFDFIRLIAPESVDLIKANLDKRSRGKEVGSYDYSLINRNGERIEAINTSKLIQYEGQAAILGVVIDITARKKTEEALKQSEERYRDLVERMPNVIYTIDSSGILTSVNRAVETLLGFLPEQIIGRHFIEFIPQEEHSQAMAAFQRIFAEGKTTETTVLIDKDGMRHHVEFSSTVIENEGRKLGAQGIILDITERKKTIEAALEQQVKFQKYLDIAGVMFIALEKHGNVTLVNQKGCEILGSPLSNIIGKNWFDNFIPDSRREETRAVFDKLMAGESGSAEYSLNLIVTQNGTERIIAWHNALLRDRFGRIIGTLSSGEDITDRKRAEQTLEENEKRFRATFEQAAVGLAHVAPDGRFIRINQRFCDIVGYSREEMIKLKFHDITHLDDLEADLEHARDVLSKKISIYSREKRYLRKDGSLIWVNITVSLLREDSGEPKFFITVAEDITERKKAEKQLHEYQERLRSLASELSLAEERTRRSAAADLHDNVCQALVLSMIKLQNLKQSADSMDAEVLEQVCNAIDSTIQDVRNLTFDLSSPTLYTFGLEAAVSELLEDELKAKHGIDGRFVNDETDKPLDSDVKVLLFQSIRELLINIVKHAHASAASVAIERENDMMKVTVEDDGVGFEVCNARLPGSREGGFGLFNIRERLDYVGGNLVAESHPGSGSRFVLRVPLRIETYQNQEEQDVS